MRAFFSFEQAMSPAMLTIVFQIVSAFIPLFAIFGALAVLTSINTPNFFAAVLSAIGMLGLGLASVLVLRLLGEIWMTNLRVQDRLSVLIEQGKERR
jgi:hypothetical protein